MRGLGRHTKRGSGFLVGGVMGGAVVPPLMGVAADIHGTPLAMVVPMMFFVAAETYAIAVNFVPAYRDPADAFSTTEVGLQPHTTDEEKVRHDNLEVGPGGGATTGTALGNEKVGGSPGLAH